MSGVDPAPAPDFVDRLVIKTLGAGELPVPRLPSVFEPLQAQGDREVEDAGEPAEPDRAAAPPLRAAPSPHIAGLVAEPAPRHPVDRLDVGPAAGARRSHASAASADHDRRGGRGAARTAPPALEPRDPGVATARRSPSRPRPDHAAASDSHPGALPATTDPMEPRRPHRDATLLASAARPEPGPATARREAERGATDDASQAADGMLVPQATGLGFAGAATESRAAGRAAPGPAGADGEGRREVAVHVTIGRVEVRATRPAGLDARRAQPRGPQPLALDEYLGHRRAR